MLPGTAVADPGDPDTAFGGGDGRATTDIVPSAFDFATGAASNASGRVYVAGFSLGDCPVPSEPEECLTEEPPIESRYRPTARPASTRR